MLGAQAAWDATMAFHAVKAWREAKDERAIVVVLVGSGHVVYGLGIARQARRSFDGEVSSVIPMAIAKGEKGDTTQVRASSRRHRVGRAGGTVSRVSIVRHHAGDALG